VRAAGPPARSDIDAVLLGWSSKIFDQYNIFDLFPCGSAFNVAQWCDPSYDALMRKTVRELDDGARWRLERDVLAKLRTTTPAAPVAQPSESVTLAHGVTGFSWSPIGFYELMGMTRS
jgi:dipeptide transport system substrate-binding protein